MDSTQKGEVRELKHVLAGLRKGDKCIPCRVMFFFSFAVFVCVIIFILYVRIREQSLLKPLPPELTPQLSPQEYEQGLIKLESAFHQQPVAPSPLPVNGI